MTPNAFTITTDDHHYHVPIELRSTARDWFDGAKSAMYEFSMSRPCNASKLLNEAEAALTTCITKREEWEPKLTALRDFAAKRVRRAKADQALEKALVAAVDADVQSWRLRELHESAIAAARLRPDVV